MHTSWRLWLMLCMGLALTLESGAQEVVPQVTLRITAVKESDWQREQARPAQADGLRERLNARTVVELSGAVKEDKPTILRSGQERGIVTEWKFDHARDEVVAKKTAQELIGTEVRLQQEPPKNHAGATRISLTLTHDLSPPQSLSIPYADAAVGAEREKRRVTAPRFERLRWQGEVLVGVKERMIANFQPAHDASTRIVVFFKGSGGSTFAPGLEVQQTIYRVPEMDMLECLLQGTPDDAALVQHLQAAVAAGQARIVSSATLAVAPYASTEMQAGAEWWLPSESDQIFDRLYLPPVAFHPALAGTRLMADATGGINSFYSPRAPLAVQWPTSWLRVRNDGGPADKAIHGWMEWFDRFEQQILGATFSDSTAPQVMAMMPPADQVWGADRQGRWLDVTVAQVSGDLPKPAAAHPADPFAAPASPFGTSLAPQSARQRSLILGFALDRTVAHALLEARQPEQDEALLRDLLARVKRGGARVMSCAFSAHPQHSGRHTQTSARIHDYPTEMPSIPSAWEARLVGTQLLQDEMMLGLAQALAPPARTEWKLARDMPEAIMWQPRFRELSLRSSTAALITPGTHLLAAVDVPAVMAGPDLPAKETLLLFSRLADHADTAKDKPHDFEIETLIYEIPATAAAAWQTVKPDDLADFTKQQLKSGHAKLQSHAWLRLLPKSAATLSVVEEFRTATAFDPPTRQAPFRMRPTALQMLPVGLQFEAEVTEEAAGSVSLKFKLQHSTARPVEPGLEETLQISMDESAPYPGAKHVFDAWSETIRIQPGSFYRLGLAPSPGGGGGSTRIALVRVRPAR